MLYWGQIYHLNSPPVPLVTFSLGHFSLQALEEDSCTRKGAVQKERGEERGEKDGRGKKKRDTLKTVAVFRTCSAWWD